MNYFKKFPHIESSGEVLVWDSRQDEGGQPEIVLLRPNLSSENKAQILKRKNISRVLCEKEDEKLFPHEKVFVVDSVEHELSQICAHYFQDPSLNLTVLGVTGTNGKSSCVDLLVKFLSTRGEKVAKIGTLGLEIYLRGKLIHFEETGFTTPESPALQAMLAALKSEGVRRVVMEVSSHAISLYRTAHVHFDLAAMTNLSEDHLDFHGTMENYLEAKTDLFKVLLANSQKPQKKAVFFIGDAYTKRVYKECADLNLGFDSYAVSPSEVRRGIQDETLRRCLIRDEEFLTPLVGEFSYWNVALCLECVRHSLGFDLKGFKEFLWTYRGPKGRLEEVKRNVFVDYAHTPDALEKVLVTLRSELPDSGKLLLVFGCGGDRDRAKRPLMGAIAQQYSDVVVLTNDNPRGEAPQSIVDAILSGMNEESRKVHVELSRSLAIRLALEQRGDLDIVLVAGKGHEDYQIIGEQRSYFSDQEEIAKILNSEQVTSDG